MPLRQDPGPDDPIEPVIRRPGPTAEVTAHYEFVDTSWLDGERLFRVVHHPPASWQNAEQYRAQREDLEEYYYTLSMLRFVAHRAAEELDFPARCTRRACRREGACVGERHEFDWSFPGPWMPPCASTGRLIDMIRDRIRDYCDEAEARG